MLTTPQEMLELLGRNPRRPDSEFAGEFSNLNYDQWKSRSTDSFEVLEVVLCELKGQIPKEDYLRFAAQCLYRWLGKGSSEYDLFKFLDTAFGTKSD
ncbi:hypothetical protein QP794_02705 [Paenibacillus sp. UMB7766-LJ446]|uniref:hypothetical protein n=1 Tax=Paenibacillus sp. UMB7766-LJ446 TaxID=3046313 RepID=UPI00254CA715|nr:hypothetical protein [Paenibacillus sp. UMB7766-LJ446]MDK8188996.1 hypothetical protein [Paenibacillus sp. UMB7766-LJ446]